MTVRMLRAAGAGIDDSTPDVWAVEPGRLIGRAWDIEPDLSGAAPFLAAALVTGGAGTGTGLPRPPPPAPGPLRELAPRPGGRAPAAPARLTARGDRPLHELDAR